MSVLKVSNMTKLYDKTHGVSDINFEIKSGEIVGFIGPNGSGKSTTIRSILGLIKHNSGSISIFGKDNNKNLVDVLKKIGYLPSEVFYYDSMTAKDLLKYSSSFYDVDCNDRIIELAKYFELDLSLKIRKMSLGNKKKVGIIQGLIHSPDLIILDEPTSGLDPLMQKKFFSLLKKENERGASILFSSHNLAEVEEICDRVIVIKEGKIIETKDIKDGNVSQYKKVKLVVEEGFKVEGFEDVKDLKQNNNVVTFISYGDIAKVINKLNNIPIKDLEIIDPTLEEVFFHFYE